MAKGCKKAKEPKEVKKAKPALSAKKEIRKAQKAEKKEKKRKDKIEKKAYAKALKKANSDKFLTIIALLLTAATTVLTFLLDKREKEIESKSGEDTAAK